MFLRQDLNMIQGGEKLSTDLKTRIMLPCFLPCTLPLRPANRSPSQRDRERDTRSPGAKPTNLLPLSALPNDESTHDGSITRRLVLGS